MVAENRYGVYADLQHLYDCQRCGANETLAMKKRVRDFCTPYCDECLEAMKHGGHGPGSGLICYSSTTRIKSLDGKTVSETTHHKPIPIGQSPTRCRVCFAADFSKDLR